MNNYLHIKKIVEEQTYLEDISTRVKTENYIAARLICIKLCYLPFEDKIANNNAVLAEIGKILNLDRTTVRYWQRKDLSWFSPYEKKVYEKCKSVLEDNYELKNVFKETLIDITEEQSELLKQLLKEFKTSTL